MKLNSKNIFAKYYNWIYNELPNDVCSFFWGTIFAIIFSVFLVIGRLLSDPYEGIGDKFGKGVVFWVAVLSVIGTGSIFWPKETLLSIHVLVKLLIFLVSGGVVWSLFLGVIGLGVYLNDIRKEKLRASGNQTAWEKSTEFLGAVRGKYCTKIEWK